MSQIVLNNYDTWATCCVCDKYISRHEEVVPYRWIENGHIMVRRAHKECEATSLSGMLKKLEISLQEEKNEKS